MKRFVIMAVVMGWGVWMAPEGWAQEAAPAGGDPSAVAAAPAETVLLDDEVPAGGTTAGSWEWETAQVAHGAKAHGHPAAKGQQQHSVTLADAVTIPRNAEIVTSVWLDPANPPRGVMIKFTLEPGEETGVYWEGEEEVFNPGENEEVWYYGLLPEYGVWTPLSVLAEDLGIEEAKLKGITFVTFDGRVLWDQTLVRQAAPAPELPPLEEDLVGVPDAEAPEAAPAQ